ncbi:MAG: PilZ domain-containing protein, partial [SAR324 cluster bacterium]|nr:PilZ domain-containing protein [SAR324 cluster bacterium]
MDPDYSDRRTTIRFPLNSERALSVSEIIETRLLDISLGGVSFRSSKSFEVGNRITIGNDLLSFSATVLETVRVVDEEQD